MQHVHCHYYKSTILYCKEIHGKIDVILEFYNPDKGRRTLNLTEKDKKSAGSKENKKSKTSGKRAQK